MLENRFRFLTVIINSCGYTLTYERSKRCWRIIELCNDLLSYALYAVSLVFTSSTSCRVVCSCSICHAWDWVCVYKLKSKPIRLEYITLHVLFSISLSSLVFCTLLRTPSPATEYGTAIVMDYYNCIKLYHNRWTLCAKQVMAEERMTVLFM